MNTSEWIQELQGITVLELSNRIKLIEETFGVSAKPVTALVPAIEAETQEKVVTAWDIVLTSNGERKMEVIKALAATLNIGVLSAKKMTDQLPFTVLKEGDKVTVQRVRETLEGAGASVEVIDA